MAFENPWSRVLQAHASPEFQGVALNRSPDSAAVEHNLSLSKFAFPQTLHSSKTCGFLRHTSLETRATQCQLPSVVKERRSGHQLPIGTPPRQAERGYGLEPIPRNFFTAGLQHPSNKKPGNERRADPPIFWAAFLAASQADVLEARFLSTRSS
jgi:hypothetical protein